MNTSQSIGINKWAKGHSLEQVWARGEADEKTIGWQRSDGERAIETNGDPVFPGESGFEVSWAVGVELQPDTGDAYRITGADAVRLAERDNLTVYCDANPTDDGGTITVAMARAVVREDPSLVYVLVSPRGWWIGQRASEAPEGYNVHDYWSTDGTYLGPDDDGIEPTFDDAAPAEQ